MSIGRLLARRLKGRWHTHILAKVRRTSSQVSLPVTERRHNLRGAFRVALFFARLPWTTRASIAWVRFP